MALCADQEPASLLPIRGTHQEKIKAPQPSALVKALCVFCVYLYRDAQLYVFVGPKRHVKTAKIDLDLPEVVNIQGHWITIPV